jgi:hypothetical protein
MLNDGVCGLVHLGQVMVHVQQYRHRAVRHYALCISVERSLGHQIKARVVPRLGVT